MALSDEDLRTEQGRPLTLRTASTSSLSQQQSSLSVGNGVSSTANNNNKVDIDHIDVHDAPSAPTKLSFWNPTLVVQTVVALAVFVIGWNVPLYFIHQAFGEIAQKPAPYQTTMAGDIILDGEHSQPLVDPPTIPSEFLKWTSTWIPLLLVSLTAWLGCHHKFSSSKNNPPLVLLSKYHDLHGAVCGFSSAIGLSEGATQLLKLYMQRRRPNFYALCDFDALQKQCMAPISRIVEGNLSFPSGHSSLTCCGMTFLAWFWLAKVLSSPSSSSGQPTQNPETKRCLGLLSCLLPWGWAVFVAASRVADHWHHPSDVVAGLMLGFSCATLVYHYWYPPVWSSALQQQPVGLPWSYHWAKHRLAAASHKKAPPFRAKSLPDP